MYEFNITLDQPFEQAIETVREALLAEQLGIVSDVDVQGIFAAKLGKSVGGYRILGACNPKLADRVIASEPNAGTLLPCNVVVRDTGQGKTVVSFLDPAAILGLTESAEAHAVATEARAMLDRVVERLA